MVNDNTPARIKPLEPPYEPEIASTLKGMMPPGMEPLKLFRTIARNEQVLKNFVANGKLVYANSSLDKADRELVIHRACARCGGEYEWGVHAALFGAKVGLTEEKLKATVSGQASDDTWREKESLLIRLVDQLHDGAKVSDDLWAKLAAFWSESQLIELIVVVGFYHTVSFVTNALGIEPEEFAARFPSHD